MPALSQKRLRRALAFSTAEGATATIIVSLLNGTFLTAIVLWMGATPWQVGLAASLGPAMQALQVFFAYAVERAPSRRQLSIWTLVPFRLIWSAAGLVALVLPQGWNLPVFLLLYAVAFLLCGPGATAWAAIMTDMVPQRVRGRYFGGRWTMNTFLGMLFLMLAGWAVDHFPGGKGFAILYGLAMLTSLANWYTLTELPELPTPPAKPVPYWEHLRQPFRNPPFRMAVVWLPAWTLVQTALPPFFTVLMARHMGLSYSLIGILTSVNSVASALSFRLWGRLIDRKGSLWLAGPSAILAATVPFLWLPAAHLPVAYLFLLHVLMGIVAAGLQTLTLQMNMQLAPANQRAVHLAVMSGANGLAGFLGPLLAGVLAEAGRFDWLFAGAGLAGLALGLVWHYRCLPHMNNDQGLRAS